MPVATRLLYALPLLALASALAAADQVSFKAGNYYVYENTPSVTVSVVRSGTLSGTCSVQVGAGYPYFYGFPTPAVAGTDYNLTLPLTVNFADGQREATFTVPLLDDAAVDGGKFIALQFTGSPVNCSVGSPSSTAVAITDDEAPTAAAGETIGGPSEVAVAENAGTARVPVRRSGSGAVSVTYSIDNTSPATTGTLTWAAGDLSTQFIQFPLTDDAIGNYGLYGSQGRGRRFNVSLSAGPAGATLLSTSVLVVDDDGFPAGLIRLPYGGPDGLIEPLSGSVDVAIPVERVFGTNGAASVSIALDTGTANIADAADVDLTTASVSWLDGELGVKYLHYAIKADALVEKREAVALVFTATGAAFYDDNAYYNTALPETIQTFKRAVGSITDASPSTASGVQWVQLNHGVREGSTASLAVSRFGSTAGACSVQAAISNGAGASNADWTATSQQTLSWADGEGGVKYVTIAAVDDALTEQPETLQVHLGNAVGTTIGGTSDNTVLWIYDNTEFATGTQAVAPSRIQFVGEAYRSVDEILESYTVQVERRGDTSGAVSTLVTAIPPAYGIGAVLGADYQPLCQTVSWAAGEAGIKDVVFHVVNDAVVDPYEACRIELSAPLGWGVLGSATELSVNIADSEPYGTMAYDVTCAGATLVEGTPGGFTLVRNQADTSAPLTVRWLVHVASDLNYHGRLSPNMEMPLQTGTVTWAAGEHDDRTVALTVLDNAVHSSGYYAYLRLYNDSANPATVQDNVYLAFTDDEPAPSTGSYDSIATTATVQPAVAEGASTTFQMKRSGPGIGAVTALLTYNQASSAAPVYGRDFTVSPTVLNWADGDLGARTITVTALNDDQVEDAQVVNIGFAVVAGNAYGNQIPVTLLDTVGPAGEILPLVNSVTQAEDATTYTLTMGRMGGTSGAVDVTYATVAQNAYIQDGATPGADYVPTAGVLHWNDGEGGNKTATVTLVDDSLVEFPETFFVNAYATGGPAAVRGSGSLVQIIDDDDTYTPPAPAFRFMHTAVAVTKADGRAPLVVRRTPGPAGTATVVVSVTGGTAVSGTDYAFSTQTYGFYSGTYEQVVSVYLMPGATDGRTIVLSLSDPSSGYAVGSPSSVTVTIGAGGGGSTGGGGGGDTTAPALTIVSVDGQAPSGGVVEVTDTTVDVALTASDAVGVTTLTYTLNGGAATPVPGSGGSRTIAGLALQAGVNTLQVKAGDAAGNLTTRSVTIVTPTPDTTAPTVSVATVAGKAPVAGAVAVSSGTVAVAISASDDVAVTAVTWKLGSGAFTAASGSGGTWSIASLTLAAGANTLVVRASDAAGNHQDATVVITLQPRQTFTLDKERIDGAPITPTTLGLGAGDLQRYDPASGTFVDVAAGETLVTGHSYLLADGVSEPALPAADYQAPTGNTIGGLAHGWNLATTAQAATWSDGGATVSVDGGAAVGLDQAIADGLIRPYCWIYDPATGQIKLVTRNPANVPGATSAIPAGATVWVESLSGGTVTITFTGGAG